MNTSPVEFMLSGREFLCRFVTVKPNNWSQLAALHTGSYFLNLVDLNQNLDWNYTFLIYLVSNKIMFKAPSIGKWQLQFDLI